MAADQEVSIRSVLGSIIFCLLVAGMLSSARLVTAAERQEFGSSRDTWLKLAHGVDALASEAGLNQPAHGVERLVHPDESMIDDSGEIILGDLASVDPSKQPERSTTTATATSAPARTGAGVDTSTAPTLGPPVPTSIATPAPTSTVAPTTSTSASTAPATPPLRNIRSDDRLRIWAGGDSLGEYVGSKLLYNIADPDLSEVVLDYHISTGITRPDYFDWPATLSNVMLANDDLSTRPEAIVYMVGGNDDQPMRTDDGPLATNSPEWLAEYRIRVATMMDITAYSGVRFYWIGLPPMADERREAIALNVNALLAEEAATREWVTFVDVVPLLLNGDGVYDQYIVGPDGQQRRARESDGIHVTASASEWISALVWDQISADWEIPIMAAE